MTISEAIIILLRRDGITMKEVGEELGRPRQTISSRLKQKNLSVGLASEMLRAMGYKLIVVREEEEMPTYGLEIE